MSKKEEIIILYKKGKTYREIASQLTCSISVISYHCTRAGFGRVLLAPGEAEKREKLRYKALKLNIKQKAVSYKGGMCSICGYKKCLRALEFHHVDPTKKDFMISKKTNWQEIQKELDKCILLCSNCHAEIHEQEFNSPT